MSDLGEQLRLLKAAGATRATFHENGALKYVVFGHVPSETPKAPEMGDEPGPVEPLFGTPKRPPDPIRDVLLKDFAAPNVEEADLLPLDQSELADVPPDAEPAPEPQS